MYTKIIKSNDRGSVTIEAAIIVPFVMLVCLLILSFSTMTYTHSKVQHILNQVCVELSYDSYMFDEFGLVDKVHSITDLSKGEPLTIEQIQNFGSMMKSNPMKSIEGGLKEELDFNNPLEFIGMASSGLEIMNKSIEISGQIKDSLIEEGVYFVTSSFGKEYVSRKLDGYFLQAGLNISFNIDHLDMYTHDDSGVVIISYDCQFPFGLLKQPLVKQTNSGYFQLFNGHGDYDEKYHKDIKTSTYGSKNSDEELCDEDGYYKKVYMTENGTKYHKNPLCFHIKVNSYPVTLSSISDKRPCSHCANQSIDGSHGIVFTTLNSDVYHSSPTCHSIFHNITILSEKEAILKGYGACGTCSN